MTENENIKAEITLLKKKGLIKDHKDMAEKLGYKRKETISENINRTPLDLNFLSKFCAIFDIPIEKIRPNVSKGPKIVGRVDLNTEDIVRSPEGRFPKPRKKGPISFFDADFAAGDIEFHDDSSAIKPAYFMDIPDFNGCTAFRIYGDSMEKLIKSGSIVFGTKLEDWRVHLEYGQIYGIVCNNGRRYTKQIKKPRIKAKQETHFLLHSENPDYDDFTIPKDAIKNIWLIHGWLNKRV